MERKICMKPIMNVIVPVLSISLLGACSANSTKEKPIIEANEVQNNEQNVLSENEINESNKPLTQDEVIESIKPQLKTDLTKILPNQLPLEKGKNLTATTKASRSQYEVVFYESNKQIPINDQALRNDQQATSIARVTVKKYDSVEEASDQIAYEEFSKLGGEPVDLGFDLTGYQDAGMGSLWTSWNEGRWALTAHGRLTDGDKGKILAQKAVEYLETHSLPIPKPNGTVHIDVYQSDNRITWQKENITYTIDQVKDPMNALEIVTSFE